MHIVFEQNAEHFAQGINQPERAKSLDSGIDIYSPVDIKLKKGERATVDLGVKFELKLPFFARFLKYCGLGIEAHVRPKSGRSKAGIDVEIGTIDEGYRNFCGATITNNTGKDIEIKRNEKICQIVFVPVFNRIGVKEGKVDANTERGLGGFGSTGLMKVESPAIITADNKFNVQPKKESPQKDASNTKKGDIKVSAPKKTSKKKEVGK